MKYDYVIIGGSVAGTTAAETIREHDRSGTILIISAENHPLYSRVLLPAYIKEEVVREKVFLRKSPTYDKKNISVFFGQEAGALDVRKKEVTLKDGGLITYKKLLIASGSAPAAWAIHGREFGEVYRMHTIEDADAILRDIKKAKSAVVIGDGFIALEFLDAFYAHHVPATLLCQGDGPFGRALDDKGQRLMRAAFETHHIALAPSDEAVSLVPADEKKPKHVLTRMKRELPFDMIGLANGLERNFDIAKGGGLQTSAGGIITNEFLETNEEGVYAAGDVADYTDVLFGKHRLVGDWTSSFLQGEVAGLNMTGQKIPFRAVNVYSLKALGLHITLMGMTPDETDGIMALSRMEERSLRYERFFIKDNRMVGAVIINMFKDKPIITRIIEEQLPIDQYYSRMEDLSFDLSTICAPKEAPAG